MYPTDGGWEAEAHGLGLASPEPWAWSESAPCPGQATQVDPTVVHYGTPQPPRQHPGRPRAFPRTWSRATGGKRKLVLFPISERPCPRASQAARSEGGHFRLTLGEAFASVQFLAHQSDVGGPVWFLASEGWRRGSEGMGAQAGASNGSAQAERGRVPAAKDPRHKDGPQKKQSPGQSVRGAAGRAGVVREGPHPPRPGLSSRGRPLFRFFALSLSALPLPA